MTDVLEHTLIYENSTGREQVEEEEEEEDLFTTDLVLAAATRYRMMRRRTLRSTIHVEEEHDSYSADSA